MGVKSAKQVVSVSFPSASLPYGMALSGQASCRFYRLVDQQGAPHPVLDDLYDSHDAAWEEATHWWSEEFGPGEGPVGIGVEVSTASGDWRTLRHPCC
jgi:hypothetical protein